MLTRTPADLGAFIRERRTKLGLDQRSLAQKVGISRKWIVEIEKGKPRAEIGLILRTLKALGVSIELTDGTTKSIRVDWPLGHPRRPMSIADFDAKAVDCFRAAARPLRDGARKLRELVDGLESLDDIRSLIHVLEPAS